MQCNMAQMLLVRHIPFPNRIRITKTHNSRDSQSSNSSTNSSNHMSNNKIINWKSNLTRLTTNLEKASTLAYSLKILQALIINNKCTKTQQEVNSPNRTFISRKLMDRLKILMILTPATIIELRLRTNI